MVLCGSVLFGPVRRGRFGGHGMECSATDWLDGVRHGPVLAGGDGQCAARRVMAMAGKARCFKVCSGLDMRCRARCGAGRIHKTRRQKMIYQWKMDGLYSVPAQAAGEELERIYDERGKIDPADVVDESRPETAVLHPCFEWRDDVAADKYREEQARSLVRCIVTVQESDGAAPVKVRAFFHADEAYHPTAVIIREEDKYEQLVRAALGELASFRRKYSVLSNLDKLRAVFSAIDDMVGGVSA